MRKNIRIENPISGMGFTSANRAKRYIARGLAEWTTFGVSIRFLRDPRDHRVQSIERSMAETAAAYDRASRGDVAQEQEIGNLPMVNPGRVLGRGRHNGATRRSY